jgi:hypothetical protein
MHVGMLFCFHGRPAAGRSSAHPAYVYGKGGSFSLVCRWSRGLKAGRARLLTTFSKSGFQRHETVLVETGEGFP